MNQKTESYLPITLEQSKLLESSLRIKIMHVLAEEEKTSKQVADLLEKTPGNVHYHIQKLLEAGLLEMVKTQEVKGVVEKYYRSKGTIFRAEQLPAYEFEQKHLQRLASRLSLSAEEHKEFYDDLVLLLKKWEGKETSGEEYGVLITLGKIKDE